MGQNLPVMAVAGATVALAIFCQWWLQTSVFYSTALRPGQPWAQWDWPAIVVGLLALLVLAGFADRDWDGRDSAAAPRHEWLLVAAIMALAAFMRTVALDTVPTGFFQDEAINGNDALALFDGRPFELWSDSIGGRPTLFLYMLGASLQVLGRSYLALKVVPVAFGVASVFAVYALGRVALGPRPALWGAFFLAVSWWHLTFSRLAWEVTCVTFFSAAGFALLLRGLGSCRHPVANIIGAAALLTVGFYTYAAYRAVVVIVVVFLAMSLLSSDRVAVWHRAGALVAAGLIALVLAAPLIDFAWKNPKLYWRRYDDVSLTKYMRYHGTPIPWAHQIGKAVLALNQRGIEHEPGSPPYLDPVTGALLLLGLLSRAPADRRRGMRLLWAWFVTFLALSSLTRDSPHMTRNLGVVPAVVLFAGYGAARCWRCCVRQCGAPRHCGVGGLFVVCALALNAYQYFIGNPTFLTWICE
jgi:hypothetical protein